MYSDFPVKDPRENKKSAIHALFVAQSIRRFLAERAPGAGEAGDHCQNQAYGYGRRRYSRHESPLHTHEELHHRPGDNCAGEAGETEVWLDFSRDFGYIEDAQYQHLIQKYDEVNRMLYGMIEKADKFCH